MSRFVSRFGPAALGFLGAAALSGPALADALPFPSSESCAQWSSRAAPGCRIATRSVRRHALVRTAMVEPRRSAVLVESRYVSLLILGVGF